MELPPTRQELVINLVSLSASLASHSSLQVICHNPVLQGPRAFHWTKDYTKEISDSKHPMNGGCKQGKQFSGSSQASSEASSWALPCFFEGQVFQLDMRKQKKKRNPLGPTRNKQASPRRVC
ncbi:hypothetical protein Y1Q_0019669 [Alligator mississippiensis]|uniref:Uncharacterized protein n=1 Tax=Alligator mississippiensis TaxID=8496 RepID=A0A151PEW2_ALLMI|nr:hypothetical protein Y1Q_0019669 [Alligator mississippiensis]